MRKTALAVAVMLVLVAVLSPFVNVHYQRELSAAEYDRMSARIDIQVENWMLTRAEKADLQFAREIADAKHYDPCVKP